MHHVYLSLAKATILLDFLHAHTKLKKWNTPCSPPLSPHHSVFEVRLHPPDGEAEDDVAAHGDEKGQEENKHVEPEGYLDAAS